MAPPPLRKSKKSRQTAKRKKKQADQQVGEKSIQSVVMGLVAVILIAGWGCMASSYDAQHADSLSEHQEEGVPSSQVGAIFSLTRALVIFADTALTQIPNFFSVIGWHLQHRIWLPIAIGLLTGCAVLFGFGLKMMEGIADDPYAKARAKREKQKR